MELSILAKKTAWACPADELAIKYLTITTYDSILYMNV